MPLSFYILALIMVASAFAAMTLRNLIHCALSLAVSFIAMAALFLQLGAPFIAFAQILVYVGAVAILIVFAILLTRSSESPEERRSTALLPSLAVAALLGGTLIVMLLASRGFKVVEHDFVPTVAGLGQLLMTTHVLPLQLAGVLLTAALIGAVIIAMRDPASPKREEDQ